ncbi:MULTISPECIES: DMT family transporter [Pseudoalteromonas]|uniref:Inner membrane transporter RhtA n=1 Tax=Pseudoalteromonas nigrifaciens TaxID=28109 RepID=A0AAC9UIM3_9GAMM|nr:MULTISPECIES: DMT family transporter [Pseudoalteromonas]ASM55975.1 inner membrane transporter RhtA [Pseudoalteromonas nigrifaciens]MBB1372171.1 DMT family transporter [Pseudoalteromonas sp. SR45-4]MBB1405170.1 DMT family transporter [Pseudoalteromonas sp. SG44-5]MBE0420941.1 DMT family transporter [Pseudoalteromonas nigrifaciens]MBH0073506.1 DMT family transporter [Pseudoalteromonas sp. NZS127]|tara:strand:+ start:12629 stop:13489 length:861 start_codon:yes stop_codon:yes gene_type:complete
MHSSTKELLLAVFCILLAMVTIQSGASLAKQLFPIVGPEGTTALRLGFSATILCLIFKPWKHLPAAGQRFPILIYGLSLGGMNILFYYAIERIPLGIGVALEFTGPLAVALFSSRRKRDLFWVGCAIAGILLLLPDMKGQESLDPVGVILALAAGACWAGYILFGKKTGNQGSGGATVAMGMTISAIVLVPYGGILQASSFSWDIIPLGIAIAVLSSALPYTLEMITLRNMSSQGFSIMMSLEPAIAALAGLLILGELLSIWQWLAILLVIIASVGSSTSKPQSSS